MYDENFVYPSLKGDGAKQNLLDIYSKKTLKLNFNCLGIEGTTTLMLKFDLIIYQPIILYINKQCGKGIFNINVETIKR